MKRVAEMILGALALAGCASPSPSIDAASTDAEVADAAGDTSRADAPAPGTIDAWSREDVGPDEGPLGCAMPGMAVPVTMPPVGTAWTATLDPSMRVDHHTVSCAPDAVAPDVVLFLDVTTAGHLVIETTDPTLDTVLAVRTACDDTASEIACNDDAERFAGASRVSLDVSVGTRLFVIVDTRMPSVSIPVRATLVPLRAAGESCDLSRATDACVEGAFCADMGGAGQCRLVSDTGCPPAGAFVDLGAYLVGRRARYEGTLVGRPDTTAPRACPGLSAMARPDAVHRLVMPFRGRVDAIAFGAISPLLYVRTACADPASERACDVLGGIEASALGVIEPGTELFFLVEPVYGEPGDYTLVVDLDRVVAAGEACAVTGLGIDVCDASLVCRDEGAASGVCREVVCGDGYVEGPERCDRPRGVPRDGCSDTCEQDDDCAMPIDLASVGTPIGAGLMYRGSNVGSSDRVRDSCSGGAGGGGDLIFEYVARASGTLIASTAGSTYDTVLYTRDVCTGTDTSCNDDFRGGVQSQVTISVVADQHVIIVVDGYAAASRGDLVLTVTNE